eukprot:CAMPEP_0201283232 /NCGR_PEP_ID=MMETSP1317-20130820/8002_1 /ASSEMBLY_ACC=CAM_ASM_000770 /TAXON_ID=187299 /ORGANISM="Undescribed Undescribed, Strain Undescribed" /LENGTH=34 /DNA_ID= /DNA_START= /DNA_END= /DNA_ORIENTATION=
MLEADEDLIYQRLEDRLFDPVTGVYYPDNYQPTD